MFVFLSFVIHFNSVYITCNKCYIELYKHKVIHISLCRINLEKQTILCFYIFLLYLSSCNIFVFLYLFEPKMIRIDILRRSVRFPASELPSDTISWIFGWCLYQNNPGLSWSLRIGNNLYKCTWNIIKLNRIWLNSITKGIKSNTLQSKYINYNSTV